MSDISDFSDESDHKKKTPKEKKDLSSLLINPKSTKSKSLSKRLDPDKIQVSSEANSEFEKKSSAASSEGKKRRVKQSIELSVADKALGTLSPPEFLAANIVHDSKCFHRMTGYMACRFENEIIIGGGQYNKQLIEPFQLIKFKPITNFFNNIVPIDEQPRGRTDFCMVTIPECENEKEVMILFGGEDIEKKELNDLWKFDARTSKWTDLQNLGTLTIPKNSDYPKPRRSHAMTVDPNTGKLYIYGGYSKSAKDFILNDGFSMTRDGVFANLNLQAAKNAPPGRTGHSMVYFAPKKSNNEYLYIFGGDLNGKASATNELWCFNIYTKVWRSLDNVQGEKPSPRFNHTAINFENRMWICGGEYGGWFGNYGHIDIYAYDFGAFCWFKININEKDLNFLTKMGPSVHYLPTRSIFIFGGIDSRGKVSSDVFRMSPLCTSVSIGSIRHQLGELYKMINKSPAENSIVADNSEVSSLLNSKIEKLEKEIDYIKKEEENTLQQMNDQLQVSEGLQKGMSALQEVIKNKAQQDKAQFDRLSGELKIVLQKLKRLEMRDQNLGLREMSSRDQS